MTSASSRTASLINVFSSRVFRVAALASALLVSNALLATAPPQGSMLVFGRGGDSVGLDPANRTDGESLNVTDHIFDSLVSFKPGTTDVEPAIAEKWDISKDGLTYTFHLRKGVKFHDDTPVDADAVIFSFMRQHDPKHLAYASGAPYGYYSDLGLEKLIKSITKSGPETVRFVLGEPFAPFLSVLGMQSMAIVSPTAVTKHMKDFGFNPVGSGPFRLVKWDRNQKITLAANHTYWGGKPSVETLIFRSIPDNSTRLMEMLAGKLDAMDNPSPDDIPVIEKRMGTKVRMAKQPGFNIAYLAMNQEKKPFDDVRVRRAINHAINRKGIVDAVYAGYAEVARNPMPPTLWGYNPNVRQYDYNPETAKKLLAEAGLNDGFKTTLYAMPVPRPYMPNGRKVAEAIQGDLAKVGITAEIVSFDWGTYLEKTRNGEHDMALLGWTGDIGDPDNFLYVLLDKDNAVKPAQNIAFYKSDKLHQILRKARSETNHAKRVTLYKEAQAIIAEDAPLVTLAHSVDVVPVQTRVSGFVMDPTGRRRFDKVSITP